MVFCLSLPVAAGADVNMGSVGVALMRLLERHKAERVADTRWAGAAWHSPDGMWTPLMHSALMVRDKRGGPDFVPANI